MSEGDRSGIDMDVLDDSVVATEAVVASSNDGGVHGCSPEKNKEEHRIYIKTYPILYQHS